MKRLIARLAVGALIALGATGLGAAPAHASGTLFANPDCWFAGYYKVTCYADITGGTAPYSITWAKDGNHLPQMDDQVEFTDFCYPFLAPYFHVYKLTVTDATGATTSIPNHYDCRVGPF